MHYIRGMDKKIVKEATTLLEFLMGTGACATNTQGRKWIKSGGVAVNGAAIKIPSHALQEGDKVEWHRPDSSSIKKEKAPPRDRTTVKDFQLGGAKRKEEATLPPFEVVFENEHVLAYVKPAGWVFASPNPQVRSSYTQMKEWMSRARPHETDVHFVNRIEKESSGICLIAKDLQWRTHLQLHWNRLEKGLYVLVEGHLPADGEVTALEPAMGNGKKGAMKTLPYRTMRATETHTLLKFAVGLDDMPFLFAAMRKAGCSIVGKGAAAPDPMGRSGMHLYRVVAEGPKGEKFEIKSRVPKEFLALMKGGKGPKALPAHKRLNPESTTTTTPTPRPKAAKKQVVKGKERLSKARPTLDRSR